jgi:hypothetical protein
LAVTIRSRAELGVDNTKRTERALRGIEGKRLTYGGLVGPDPNQTRRRSGRGQPRAEQEAQLELFPGEDLGRPPG